MAQYRQLWNIYHESHAQEMLSFKIRMREAICEMLKKGPTHLVKLRHPRLLTIHFYIKLSTWHRAGNYAACQDHLLSQTQEVLHFKS